VFPEVLFAGFVALKVQCVIILSI